MITKMRRTLKQMTGDVLKKFDFRLARYSYIDRLEKSIRGGNIMAILRGSPGGLGTHLDRGGVQLLGALRDSRSQLGQDMFALSQCGFEEGGYFVEFGATNGIELSNSYVLEKYFGWTGIVAEPAKRWHMDLANNRCCRVETDCVWRESNAVLMFNEV